MSGIRLAVALDGPSGSGKSTVARGVARALGWRYVDTGATYRAATLAALRAHADLSDPEQVTAAVARADICLTTDPDAPTVRLDGRDVSQAVRGAEVTAAVSAVSAVPEVRRLMVALQRDAVGDRGAVVDGRDIADVVLPDALVKVYLNASPAVRAARRAADADTGVQAPTATGGLSGDATPGVTACLVEAVAADLARRDHLDRTRTASPLRIAADAVQLDSDRLSADQVIEQVLALVVEAGVAVRA